MSAQSESVQKERAHPLRYVDEALPPLHGLVNVWHVETLIRQDVYTLQENAYSGKGSCHRHNLHAITMAPHRLAMQDRWRPSAWGGRAPRRA
jgi:hypothetical protein